MFNSSCHMLAVYACDFIINCLQQMLGWFVKGWKQVSGRAGGAAVVPKAD